MPRAPRTSLDVASIEPLAHVDIAVPEPSVAVIAGEPGLRRRMVAALDFDRLPLAAAGDQPSDVASDVAGRPWTVAVMTAPRSGAVSHALADLRSELPRAPIVLVLHRIERGVLRAALLAGAAAAVPVSHVESALALAVRAVAADLVVAPAALREDLA